MGRRAVRQSLRLESSFCQGLDDIQYSLLLPKNTVIVHRRGRKVAEKKQMTSIGWLVTRITSHVTCHSTLFCALFLVIIRISVVNCYFLFICRLFRTVNCFM